MPGPMRSGGTASAGPRLAVGDLRASQKLIGLAAEETGQFVMALARLDGDGMARPTLLFSGATRIVTMIRFHSVDPPDLTGVS